MKTILSVIVMLLIAMILLGCTIDGKPVFVDPPSTRTDNANGGELNLITPTIGQAINSIDVDDKMASAVGSGLETDSRTTISSLNPAEIDMIYFIAKAVGVEVGQYGADNLMDILSSINCSEVSCTPEDVCRYLNIGLPGYIINARCDPQHTQILTALDEDTFLIMKLISKLPKPESCNNIPNNNHLPQPGQLAIITDVDPKLAECMDDLRIRHDYIKEHRDELINSMKEVAHTESVPSIDQARFSSVHDWATKNGYAGGFPNFHQADYGNGVVYGAILIKIDSADQHDISIAELGNPDGAEARFSSVHDWATKNGYAGGFPNFHQADYGNGVVYGAILIKIDSADQHDISIAELGNPDSVEARFRSVHDWATKNGYAGGFPNFHQADYGNGVVYGAILIKIDSADQHDIFLSDLQ